MRLKYISLLSLGLLITNTTFSQESINSSGGNVSGGGGSISYSVGQVVYTTDNKIGGSLSQGVQQVYEILVISATEYAKNINLCVIAYPNPVIEILTLTIEDCLYLNPKTTYLTYHLIDLNGKILISEKVLDHQTSIDMSLYKPRLFLLKVFKDNEEIKTFKIIRK